MLRTSSRALCLLLFSVILIYSCQKETTPLADNELTGHRSHNNDQSGKTKSYSSAVLTSWLQMQMRLIRQASVPYGLNASRYFAYSGIAAYESVLPGMKNYRSLSGQLSAMPAMPATENGQEYYWPASANAALAFMTKKFFPVALPANLAAIDSLEMALNESYLALEDASVVNRSALFGKTVADKVFEWSKTDGSLTVYDPYVPVAGPGKWVPLPGQVAAGPYWSLNRPLVHGSQANTDPPPFPAYSTIAGSPYYLMQQEVYDLSQNLSPADSALALYYRDAPGYVGGAHYIAIFEQLLEHYRPQLDFGAMAYARAGIAESEAFIGCWKIKYIYNVERPITYIRNVLGHTTWNSMFGTPPHPDFPSGHSTAGGAMEVVFTNLFGKNINFTNHTYDYLGMAPRTYHSFAQMAEEIGRSRVLAGIHTTFACQMGRQQGNSIARNTEAILQFKQRGSDED